MGGCSTGVVNEKGQARGCPRQAPEHGSLEDGGPTVTRKAGRTDCRERAAHSDSTKEQALELPGLCQAPEALWPRLQADRSKQCVSVPAAGLLRAFNKLTCHGATKGGGRCSVYCPQKPSLAWASLWYLC